MSSQDATCLRCGQSGLVWNQSVKGKWYLGVPMQHTFEDGNTVTTHIAGHNCKPTPEGLALVEARRVEREQQEAEKQAFVDARNAKRLALKHFDAQVGDAVQFSGVVERAVDIDGYYGSQRLLVVETDNQEVAKIFTTAMWAYRLDEGDPVTIRGFVGGFDFYNEVTKQSVSDNDGRDPNVTPQTLIKKPKLVYN